MGPTHKEGLHEDRNGPTQGCQICLKHSLAQAHRPTRFYHKRRLRTWMRASGRAQKKNTNRLQKRQNYKWSYRSTSNVPPPAAHYTATKRKSASIPTTSIRGRSLRKLIPAPNHSRLEQPKQNDSWVIPRSPLLNKCFVYRHGGHRGDL